ncbi:hypothetical protein BH11PSE11_BH11PSE11_19200 [soil metagenome]
MTRHEFKDGFPWLPVDASDGFRIRDELVFLVRDGKQTESWDRWNYEQESPANFPLQWVRQFWQDLDSAPRFTLSEDQWSSYYYSLLETTVVHWTDDRQQGASYLHSCVDANEFARAAYTPQEVKQWLARLLADPSGERIA